MKTSLPLHPMTEADWATLTTEFPGASVNVPPVCTAYWDLDAWRNWYRASLRAQGKL